MLLTHTYITSGPPVVYRKQPIFSDRRDCFPIPRGGYASRVAEMNGIACLDPCDYLGQSARKTLEHELWQTEQQRPLFALL